MAEVKDIVFAVRDTMSAEVCPLVQSALDEAAKSMRNLTATSLDGQQLFDAKQDVLQRFRTLFEANFDHLVVEKSKQTSVLDYGSLSLVQEDDLEAIIAMEGMIAHARNCDIHHYLCFTTRLDSMFFGTRIDESNNPMDPEQIGDAFKDSLQPVGLKPNGLLMVYRQFNSKVFHELETVLEKANEILIAHGIMPDLDIASRQKEEIKGKRSKPRPKVDPVERAFSKEESWSGSEASSGGSQQLFSMMQTLMRSMGANAGTGGAGTQGSAAGQGNESGAAAAMTGGLQSGMMVGGRQVELLATDKLVSLLERLEQVDNLESEGRQNITESIGKQLEADSDDNTLQAIDGQSSDVINVINLLYEAIWEDSSVPIPVKELLGRTQITALKIALKDSSFFDSESHPMRVLINELATAGISWTETQDVHQDPVYQQMDKTVATLINDYKGDSTYIEELIEEFQYFKRRQLLSNQETENSLMDADERAERLEDVKHYAREKIVERILDPGLSEFVREFLDTLFHKFLVQVILREGPGGVSWKPVMNTIDVLLWTVHSERTADDLDRFLKLKPRLLINLKKALDVAEVPEEEALAALRELQHVQEECFKSQEPEESAEELEDFAAWMATAKPISEHELKPLPEDDEHMQEVTKIPIGIWMEFQVEGEQTIRCTLAAKIDTIDKYVFVNSQGVKVVEKSRMGLARELKAGTVKVISEAPLIERAMETVIGKLRNA
ncbi:MAG: DUF1631 domain-containing protein [Pseudomonadales bacterium]|nr:DUF1631 domain-containing protein [Pseudomonadales bacterium]